jgi:hypothetical protein
MVLAFTVTAPSIAPPIVSPIARLSDSRLPLTLSDRHLYVTFEAEGCRPTGRGDGRYGVTAGERPTPV